MRTILLVGNTEDLSQVYIRWLADRIGIPTLGLSEDTLGLTWTFRYNDVCTRTGYIETLGKTFELSSVAGVLVRLSPHPSLPSPIQLLPHEEQWFLTERRAAIHHLLESIPAIVVNRPSAGRSNGSKPYQMRLLAKAGFTVPSWIAASDPIIVREFTRGQYENFIYKSCSGLRSYVRRFGLDVMRHLEDGTTPVIVQQYIPGRDVRVHTVRSSVFATEVVCSGVDYRFEHEDIRYRSTSIPDALAELCYNVAQQEDLIIAGFDFRVTHDDQWYCLEVNPVPNFLPYEMATGQAIGKAVLSALQDG